MKVILYMALSVDGFIADRNGKTPWSEAEWGSYKDFVAFCDVCLIGSRTYEVMKQSDEFVHGVRYIVATDNNKLDTGDFEKITISSPKDLPNEPVIGVVGGGDLNGRLAKLGVIDEVILDIEPVIFGTGVNLLGNHVIDIKLRLLDSKKLGENGIQNRYEVVK